MKIGQTPDIPPVAVPATAQPGVGAASAPAKPKPAAPGVPVTVSKLARSLEESNQNGSFDTEKVDSIRTAIENGSYKVDAEAIADKLLSNAKQVLRKAQA